jgi:hypothetical protein
VSLVGEAGGRSVADIGSLTEAITTWVDDPAARAIAGANALSLVSSGLGAAERSLRVVESLLGGAYA